ncbi:sodium/glucose cotransporter [bacterium BMS3Abin07]|nr:sodium/glucose cotransporter [bacterium BMS3Abin07]GBE33151.1 sodium/glucose cotransporter [bacterium BMS3Bbin05]HDL20410.1 sodium:proline symporter [Nitrospirota bacterium]HDO22635.1 sodium:proline symporter [Nitrospirota bacterium]HDZ87639.1 sodium:proline symporter [Nitrospirota bacterium]
MDFDLNISFLDITIIAFFMFLSLALGLYFTRRASKNTGEFFLSGRNLPWWLAGTSMVATTFSSDTPLYITGLIRSEGIYENWQWWCFILSGMLSVFFFAKLWRRLGVVTDVELIEMRYSGRSASVLRGFKSVYFSLIIHTIIKAQVILAMSKILDVTLGWGKWESITIATLITLAYATLSGYWGVVTTDFVQFILAMVGSIVLAVVAVTKAGGIHSITTHIPAKALSFFPPMDGGFFSTVFMTFLGYVGLSWWSKYSSDGGGVIVQRMASCKNERESLIATFYFNVANYALRTWPWIIAALASLIIYPVVADNEAVYPRMVIDLLPSGLKGLMLASFFAAFMSTLSTYLNLSSIYFVNDFYRPFVKKDGSEKHYIAVSRWMTIVFAIVTAIVTYYVTSIVGVFKFLIAFGSGTGLVYIIRWFWWRVNAWSEISAMVASTVGSTIVYTHPVLSVQPFYAKLFMIISFSTVVWLTVTFFTQPVEKEKLLSFYKKTLPGGYGWEPVKKLAGDIQGGESLSKQIFEWINGSLFVIAVTIGLGKALLGFYTSAAIWFSVAVITGVNIFRKAYMAR